MLHLTDLEDLPFWKPLWRTVARLYRLSELVRDYAYSQLPSAHQWHRLEAEGIVAAGQGTYGLEAIRVAEFRLADRTWVGSKLRIGNYCSIAQCSIFLGGNHPTHWLSQYPVRGRLGLPGNAEESLSKGDVEIGHDVWIGEGSTIMSGVRVGNGAVIGARSVVTKDVPPFAIVAGNPATVRRYRFAPEMIAHIEELGWWDWSPEQVRAQADRLTAPPTLP